MSNSGATYLYDIVEQDAEPQAALAAIEAGVREAREVLDELLAG